MSMRGFGDVLDANGQSVVLQWAQAMTTSVAAGNTPSTIQAIGTQLATANPDQQTGLCADIHGYLASANLGMPPTGTTYWAWQQLAQICAQNPALPGSPAVPVTPAAAATGMSGTTMLVGGAIAAGALWFFLK